VRALDDQRAAVADDDAADANDRVLWILSRHYSPITLISTRLLRRPSNSP
jgi:hypothetical protein